LSYEKFHRIKTTRQHTAAVIICVAILFTGCKPLKMVTHTESVADTYCLYKIADVRKTGHTKPLKKGDIICLYCAGDFHCVLATRQWIKVYTGNYVPGKISQIIDPGISYYLESVDTNASCTDCTGTNKFELF
jgi:hypothetical protein